MSEAEDSDRFQDNVFGDLNRLQQIMSQLDERGLILALAAFAEQALGELIGAFLIPGKPSTQLLEGFNAPLGTFGARIKSAYAMGLITSRQYRDLERLRLIRNEFAHNWQPLDFANNKIADHIKHLSFNSLDDHFPQTPREKVRICLGLLVTELKATASEITKYGRQAKVVGQHLVAGVSGNVDEQLATCRARLVELGEELKSATGDRRRFLSAARHRWENKLDIVRRTAPPDRKSDVQKLQAELGAWIKEPED